jgi:sulfur carrier protein ThiS adenylyltransferase
MTESERYARQADLVPHERLKSLAVAVIGVGAIGRQVALQLAAIGTPRLQLVDFDVVDATNVVTQGYRLADIGRLKVAAAADAISEIDPQAEVAMVADRYRARLPLHKVAFCCVDSIVARQAIWRSIGTKTNFWADGRMLGEVIRVLTVTETHGGDHYPTTLFGAAEAQTGRCTARSTIYAATIAAGIVVHQFSRWLRGLSTDSDTSINLLAGEWTVIA